MGTSTEGRGISGWQGAGRAPGWEASTGKRAGGGGRSWGPSGSRGAPSHRRGLLPSSRPGPSRSQRPLLRGEAGSTWPGPSSGFSAPSLDAPRGALGVGATSSPPSRGTQPPLPRQSSARPPRGLTRPLRPFPRQRPQLLRDQSLGRLGNVLTGRPRPGVTSFSSKGAARAAHPCSGLRRQGASRTRTGHGSHPPRPHSCPSPTVPSAVIHSRDPLSPSQKLRSPKASSCHLLSPSGLLWPAPMELDTAAVP